MARSKEIVDGVEVMVYDRMPMHDRTQAPAEIYVRCSDCSKPVKTTTSNYGAVLCRSCDPPAEPPLPQNA